MKCVNVLGEPQQGVCTERAQSRFMLLRVSGNGSHLVTVMLNSHTEHRHVHIF